MKNTNFTKLIAFCTLCFTSLTIYASSEWSGNIGVESQSFINESVDKDQSQQYTSIAFNPKYILESNDGNHLFQFTGFARINSNNKKRDHADIQDLYWAYASDTWEFRAGIRKVFWGVTESQHLVDIINQTDTLEKFNNEDKLGQPMLNFAYIKDWGTVDFFVLPLFRERQFLGKDSRLRTPFVISNNTSYDSSAKDKRTDVAIRYSHYIGDWDFGLSHFYGTSREPQLVIIDGKLGAHYDIINQTGLDVQATIENMLWKFEGIYRSGMLASYYATTFGIEYSFFDIQSSGVDIGIITEYLYDDRGDLATTPFDNDTLVGVRVALNDDKSSDALIGFVYDNAGKGKILSIEANRRIGENFKINLEGYLFFDIEQNTFMSAFRNDDYAQVTFSYFY